MSGLYRNAVGNKKLCETGIFVSNPELKYYLVINVNDGLYTLRSRNNNKIVEIKIE